MGPDEQPGVDIKLDSLEYFKIQHERGRCFSIPESNLSDSARSKEPNPNPLSPNASLVFRDFEPNKNSIGRARYLVNMDDYESGGTAYVFKAFDQKLGKVVAIKALKHEFLPDEWKLTKDPEEVLSLFQREAKLTGNLDHPGIPRIYSFQFGAVPDLGSENHELKDTAIFIMEYIDSPSLKELIGSPNQVTLEDVSEIIRQTAEVVAYLKKHGIEHSDLKPGNIFWDGERVLVSDFGLATRVRGKNSFGTKIYMSPERVWGVNSTNPDIEYGETSEVFSLGTIVYEMITRKSLVPRNLDLKELLHFHMNRRSLSGDQRALLHLSLTELGADDEARTRISYLISKAVAPMPEDRFESAKKFAQAFSDALNS